MKMMKITSACILLGAFFLPWVDLLLTTASGYQLPQIAQEVGRWTGNSQDALFWYGLYLIPLFSILTIVNSFGSKPVKWMGMIPPIILFFYVYVAFQAGEGEITRSLLPGAYVSIFAAMVLFLSSLFEKTTPSS